MRDFLDNKLGSRARMFEFNTNGFILNDRGPDEFTSLAQFRRRERMHDVALDSGEHDSSTVGKTDGQGHPHGLRAAGNHFESAVCKVGGKIAPPLFRNGTVDPNLGGVRGYCLWFLVFFWSRFQRRELDNQRGWPCSLDGLFQGLLLCCRVLRLYGRLCFLAIAGVVTVTAMTNSNAWMGEAIAFISVLLPVRHIRMLGSV